MTVGILGGTGAFGSALASRLRRLGEDVLIGSRTPKDGAVSNEEAARRAELVVLSVPPGAVEETVRAVAGDLDGKILLSAASPVVFRDGRPVVEAGPRSLAELAQEAAPGARVVAGFHTVAAKALAGMLSSLGHEPTAVGVARLYVDVAGTFVLDEGDAALAPEVEALGLRAVVAPVVMIDPEMREDVGRAVLEAVR